MGGLPLKLSHLKRQQHWNNRLSLVYISLVLREFPRLARWLRRQISLEYPWKFSRIFQRCLRRRRKYRRRRKNIKGWNRSRLRQILYSFHTLNDYCRCTWTMYKHTHTWHRNIQSRGYGDTPKKIIVRRNRIYGILYWRKYCCPGEKYRSDTPLKPRKVFIISGNDACRQREGRCWAPRHLETFAMEYQMDFGDIMDIKTEFRIRYPNLISESDIWTEVHTSNLRYWQQLESNISCSAS